MTAAKKTKKATPANRKKKAVLAKGKATERGRLRRLMANRYAEERDITIDYSLMDVNRRRRCAKSPTVFMKTYFPHIYYNPFVADQLETIKDIEQCVRFGDLKAIADSRGGGKTTIGKGVIFVWAIVYGLLKLPIIVESNMDEAGATLDDIRASFYVEPEKEGVEDFFGDDFPEICQPIRALDPESRRKVAVEGKDVSVKWNKKGVIFPVITIGDSCPDPELRGKPSPASGCQIVPRATNKAIRGIVRKGQRPDYVFINDVETDESAASAVQIDNIKHVITHGIMGLGGPGKKIGIVFLCTIINRGCVSDQFTDPKVSPEWNGKRYAFFKSWPDDSEKWERYIYTFKKSGRAAANQYYLDHRAAMDAGAVVANEYRFNGNKGPDGKPMEYSAIQHAYNQIMRMGMPAFMSEWQNDPKEDERDLLVVKPDDIAEKINHIPRGEIPAWAEVVTAAVDVHDDRLFWCRVGWRQGAIGAVVDYGVERVYSPISGSVAKDEKQKQVDIAILEALRALAKQLSDKGKLDIALVDSGYKPGPVYAFCRSLVSGVWHPSKGGSGITGKYTSPKRGKNIRNIGHGFHQSLQINDRLWLTLLNPDLFKKQTQEGLRVVERDIAGSISLFGDDPMEHRVFAEHICNEQWNVDKMCYEGPGGKKPRNNHWLDCLAGCCAAAAIKGITVMQTEKKKSQKRKPLRVGGAGIRTKY